MQHTEAYSLIKNAKNILLTTHQKPDGDALGSICALMLFLEREGKNFVAVIDNIPDSYEFIPGTHHLCLQENMCFPITNFDLIITVDFNTLDRSPISELLEDAQKENIPFINFDHHQANAMFGHANIVDDTASSTTCLIHDFFEHNNIHITPDMATCLLTGIMTDTDHLSNSSTNQNSIHQSSKLLSHGAHLYRITQNTRGNKSLNAMKLWGEALSKLHYNKKYNIAYTIITQQDLKKYNVDSEVIEGIPNFLTSLHDLHAILVLKENEDGELRGSFRTTKDRVDVSELARQLGGGGHKKAAGFGIAGELVQTKTGWKIT